MVLIMKRIGIMKLSCAEAASVCQKAEYKEANLLEKLRLKLHLFFCRRCKDYYENNKKLSSLLKKANLSSCSSQEKAHFKETMKNGSSHGCQDKEKH